MQTRIIETADQAFQAVEDAWPMIVDECRAILGGELHYQAVAYHCLRSIGVPRAQLGMNVKQWIPDPVTPLFQAFQTRKHADFRGGFEPIPDVLIFKPGVAGDWRRRNRDITLREMLLSIEVKASERHKARLRAAETVGDIRKLAAHRDEARHRGGDMHPVVMIIDTASESTERMHLRSLGEAKKEAVEHGVSFFYVSPELAESIR